jgi:hypothetical protein
MNEISNELMLEMLGGQWPDSGESTEGWPRGFAFDEVDHWECEDGRLVPYVGDEPAPGPDFKVVMI